MHPQATGSQGLCGEGNAVIDLVALQEEVAYIRADDGGNPRVHPNGFIQLDLDPVPETWHASHKKGHSGARRRLHIWNPPGVQLPHQGTVNEIHDHVFDMHSEIVKGQLWQCLYEFDQISSGTATFPSSVPKPTHELYQAVYAKNSDSRLEPTGKKGWLKMINRFPVRERGSYEQPAFTLHDTETPAGLVVTVMTKMKVHDGEASVICPVDTPPDNSYDRAAAMPKEEIWEAIERSLA